MLGAGNAERAFVPDRVPGLGKPGVAPRIWKTQCGFDKIVFGIYTLLRRLPRSSPRVFDTSTPVRPQLHGASLRPRFNVWLP
jgi:hypothetical protein